jgi:hypothetical protein
MVACSGHCLRVHLVITIVPVCHRRRDKLVETISGRRLSEKEKRAVETRETMSKM